MQVHGLSVNISGTKSCPPSKLMAPHAKESEKGQSGTATGMCNRNVYLQRSRLKNGAAWQPAGAEEDGSCCRKVRLEMMKWVSLSLTLADCKYCKILSDRGLQ